jgi:lipopolysaccharide exporter
MEENSLPEQDPLPVLPKRDLARDAFRLASGTSIAQVLTVVSSPFLTRIYSPEAFGVLSLYFSLVNIFSEVACLRYDHSIMIADDNDQAANQLAVSIASAFLTGIILIPLFMFIRVPLVLWLNAPELEPYLWLVLPSLFFGAVLIALGYWNSRQGHFGRTAVGTVINSSVMITYQILAGLMGSPAGLVMGAFWGPVAAIIFLAQRLITQGGITFSAIRLKSMVAGIKRYRKFPQYELWAGLLNVASWQLPFFLLSGFFSTTITGFYSISSRVLQIPIRVVGLAIGQSFFPRAAEAKAEGKLAGLVEGTFRRLVGISLFPLLTLSIIGSDLFRIVFGEAWQEAGVYTQLLSLWIFFWFI